MTVGVIGNGKMGRVISAQLSHDNTPHWMAGKHDSLDECIVHQRPDVLIEFTEAKHVIPHINMACDHNIPIVVGTTGWYDAWTEAESLIKQKDNALFYATNFSIGAHLFWQFNAWIAARMQDHKEYSSSIYECHHPEKKDAPSGTAITTAERIIENNSDYTKWHLFKAQPPISNLNPEVLPVSAERKDGVHGYHQVRWTSPIDQIEVSHEAFSRDGFASGAIQAARFLKGKKGIFTMEDMMGL